MFIQRVYTRLLESGDKPKPSQRWKENAFPTDSRERKRKLEFATGFN